MPSRFSLIVAMLLSGWAFAEAPVQKVAFATDPWPPFFTDERDGYITAGLGYQLVQRICAEIQNVECVLPVLPWKRSLLSVRQGTKDGIALLLKSDEREVYMRYSVPVAKTYSRIVYARKRFPKGFSWRTLDDLKPYVVGTVSGYVYGDPVDAAIHDKRFSIAESMTSELALAMLVNQRIDLMIESEPVVVDLAARRDWSDAIGFADQPLNLDVLYLGFSRKSPVVKRIPEFNRAITKLQQSGELDALLNPAGIFTPESGPE